MANYGNSDFDVRHMLKAHAAYDLPVGRGRQFVSNSKALDYAIGGWTLFGDFIKQGGIRERMTKARREHLKRS